jgi:RNA polymerase sigma-70 factor (ECF subfamily)
MRRKVDAKAMYRERYLGLLEEHTPALHRLCHSYCEARAEAEDLFQEIVLAIWTGLARFRGESSDRTWLYRIAHNVALTFATKRRKQVGGSSRSRTDGPAERGELESRLAEVQKQETLHLLVRQLPFEDRRLVLLYLEGLSTAEIEVVTGLTRSNVTVRLSRIRQRLSDRLQNGKARTVKS